MQILCLVRARILILTGCSGACVCWSSCHSLCPLLTVRQSALRTHVCYPPRCMASILPHTLVMTHCTGSRRRVVGVPRAAFRPEGPEGVKCYEWLRRCRESGGRGHYSDGAPFEGAACRQDTRRTAEMGKAEVGRRYRVTRTGRGVRSRVNGGRRHGECPAVVSPRS